MLGTNIMPAGKMTGDDLCIMASTTGHAHELIRQALAGGGFKRRLDLFAHDGGGTLGNCFKFEGARPVCIESGDGVFQHLLKLGDLWRVGVAELEYDFGAFPG